MLPGMTPGPGQSAGGAGAVPLEVIDCGYVVSGSSSVSGSVTLPAPVPGRLLVAVTVSQRDGGSCSIGGLGMSLRRNINNSWTDCLLFSLENETLEGSQTLSFSPGSSGSNSTWCGLMSVQGLTGGNSLIQNAGGASTTSANLSAALTGDVAIVHGGYRSASWSGANGTFTRHLSSRMLYGHKIIESDGTASISNGISSTYEYTFASTLFR